MSLSSLPTELLENIFEPLAPAALSVLARTSTVFYPAASRLLYRRVAVSSFARNLGAVTTLAARRHLALLVRCFSISLDDEGKDQPDAAYYAALAAALHAMAGLVSLDLNVHGASSWVLAPPPAAPATTYARLEAFACSFPLDAHTAAFLERTPDLRALQLAASPHPAALAPAAVPRLATYTGPPCLLPQLLPARPLTSLHLSGDLSLADIEHLAAVHSAPGAAGSAHGQSAGGGAYVRLETLSAITSAPPVAVTEALAKACPSLVCLRVITTCAFWETPDIAFYAQIASSLASLPALRAFELSGMHWEFRPKSASAADGTCAPSGKEWVSPPVSPRPVEVDGADARELDFAFDEAFMEWAY